MNRHRNLPALPGALRKAALLPLALAALFHTPEAAAQNTHRAALVRASSQYFSAADSTSLSITGDLTAELWVKPTSLSNSSDYKLMSKDDAPSQRGWVFRISVDASGNKSLAVDISANGSTVTTAERQQMCIGDLPMADESLARKPWGDARFDVVDPELMRADTAKFVEERA